MALKEEFEKQGIFLFKYRGVLPLIILSVGILVFVLSEINSEVEKDLFIHDIYDFLCLFVCLIGLGIRIFTVGFSPKNTSGRNTESQLADELNTTGIYSSVRHPLYLGNFFMWLGVAMLIMNFWFLMFFVFLYWVYYERIMYAEEQFLTRKFGDVYLKWAENTPAFIPSLKNWKKSTMTFSWKKVIKKEKTGILNVFILFYLFALLENYIQYETFLFLDWTFFALVTSLLYYIIVKIISKKTQLLHETDR